MQLTNDFWNKKYQSNHAQLLGVCMRYVRNISVAKDIVHETFITGISKHNEIRNKRSIDAWLRKIAVNKSLTHLRAQKQDIVSIAELNYNSSVMKALYNKDEELLPNITCNELLDCVDQLPEHHKLVFNLYVLDKFLHITISEMLGISVGTSK